MMDNMMQAIIKEMALRKNETAETIDTIYFGGGTPSIISPQHIDDLLNSCHKNFTINPAAEITLEANPDDVISHKVQHWKQAGINRISLGVQSFFEEELSFMNRSHNAAAALQSIETIKSNFNNFSVDLIYGSQLLSNEQWMHNIETLLYFSPPHISCYALTVEPKTALHHQIKQKAIANTNDDKQAVQFAMLVDVLEDKGYLHYEISNFAQPNFMSRHNGSYWQQKKYIGLGPSAHSFNGSQRSFNIANNALYISSVAQNVLPHEIETLTLTQQHNEHVMIALRTMAGINTLRFAELFGNTAQKQLLQKAQSYIDKQLMLHQNNYLALTKQGKFLADGIAADLFADEDI